MTEENQNNENKNAGPVATFRYGAIATNVWKRIVNKDDKTYEFLTVETHRNYKDKDDQWQKTTTLQPNDIQKAILGLQDAQKFILSVTKDEKKTD